MVQNQDHNGLVHSQFDLFKTLSGMTLSVEAQKIRDVPNAGGNSVVSEVLSYEMLQRCFGAKLLKTEMEVSYFPEGGSITDYTCQMFGINVGVSVTRAMKYRGDYTLEDAEKLLKKKLQGVIQSSRNTLENWSKQILHVWAASTHVANIVTQAYDKVSEDIKSNTVIVVTVASDAGEIFRNKK